MFVFNFDKEKWQANIRTSSKVSIPEHYSRIDGIPQVVCSEVKTTSQMRPNISWIGDGYCIVIWFIHVCRVVWWSISFAHTHVTICAIISSRTTIITIELPRLDRCNLHPNFLPIVEVRHTNTNMMSSEYFLSNSMKGWKKRCVATLALFWCDHHTLLQHWFVCFSYYL